MRVRPARATFKALHMLTVVECSIRSAMLTGLGLMNNGSSIKYPCTCGSNSLQLGLQLRSMRRPRYSLCGQFRVRHACTCRRLSHIPHGVIMRPSSRWGSTASNELRKCTTDNAAGQEEQGHRSSRTRARQHSKSPWQQG